MRAQEIELDQVRFVNFRYTVPASTRVVLETDAPSTGYITHATFHFPPGCLSLVSVRVLLEREPVWPVGETYVALDDATPTYAFIYPGQKVKKYDYLTCELVNNDTVNSHTVSVILILQGSLS